MSSDFNGIENSPENNRYNEAGDKDGHINFESQTFVVHFCNILKLHVLFSLGKPRPQGGVRVNWLCLEITPNGVLEYWSIGVLILKTKKRWFELSKLLKVCFC
jgi:hypothetical protein